jgi:hypothetical protein
MEQFFTPTRWLPEFGYYNEVQLAVSIEAFMNHSWDWSDFYAFVKGDEGEMWKILWITEDTFIFVVEDENSRMDFDLEEDYSFQLSATFTTPSGGTHKLVLAIDTRESSSLTAGASSIFWHAVTTSNHAKLKLEDSSHSFGLCSGPALSHFLEARSPSLELLELFNFYFKEVHCRALATLERTDLEVTLEECSFDAEGAKDTFIEWLRHSQVVTKLKGFVMEDNILSALSGNSSVKSLSVLWSFDATTNKLSDSNSMSLARVLPGNQGIEDLHVPFLIDGSGEAWSPFALPVGAPSNPGCAPSFHAEAVSCNKDQHNECSSAIGSMQYSGAYNRIDRLCKRRGILSEFHTASTRDESQLF